jgi:starch synthase (maltosyl-transferring)
LLERREIPTHFLGARHVGHVAGTWRALADRLRAWRPALLQCFLAHANVLGAVVGHRLGIRPIVAGIRVAEQRSNWHSVLGRRTARWVDKYVCVSQAVADFAEQVMRLPREKLLVIPNGIDVAAFHDAVPASGAKLAMEAGRRMILFVGRLDRQKRPDWLIERLPAIAQSLPEHDLVIVGEGPLRGTLNRRAEQLGVADRVHLVGWQPDVARFYAAADLLVLTSAWEGMPNVVLEAMAASRPVVATDVHGVVELLGDTAAEQVVPLNDPQALVAAVVRIAGDKHLATRLGTQNRQRVAGHFSIEATVRAYVELYRSLLDS